MISKGVLICMAFAITSIAATAQVTTDGGTTVNSVPYFKNSATQLSNSPIYVSGSNVGIGAPRPVAPLQVNGEAWVIGPANIGENTNGTAVIDAYNGDAFFGDNAAANGIAVNPSGYVGIGTASPLYPLDVNGPVRIVDSYTWAGVPSNAQLKLSSSSGGQSGNLTNILGSWLEQAFGGIYYGAGAYTPDGSAFSSMRENGAAIVFFNNTGLTAGTNFTPTERMRIDTSGNVGIGTTDPQYPLSVNGTIQAKEVLVNTGWSDYVFSPNYRLKPLAEVAAYIRANRHLPGIPSEAEIKKEGVSLGDMQAKLLAKIEELTLQMIQLSQTNAVLEKRVAQLEGR